MKNIRSLNRKVLREQLVEEDDVQVPAPLSIYHIRLANKFASDPSFRKSEPSMVVTQASARECAREAQETKDFKAGRNGQKESRLSVRAAHRRKVKAEKRTCFCLACDKGNK